MAVLREQGIDYDTPRAYRILGKMKNIDHRMDDKSLAHIPVDTVEYWGRRVRQMNVSRNFPLTGLVIKRVHSSATALDQLDGIKKAVQHIREQKPTRVEIREPIAYALGNKLVGMAYANYPSIEEMIGRRFGCKQDESVRGQKFLRLLKKRYGITQDDLQLAYDEVETLLNQANPLYDGGARNLLCTGVKNKKFVLVPLIDLW